MTHWHYWNCSIAPYKAFHVHDERPSDNTMLSAANLSRTDCLAGGFSGVSPEWIFCNFSGQAEKLIENYDPALGRFLARDPAKPDVEDHLTLNPYTYCRNNPVMNVDPDGEWFQFLLPLFQVAFTGGAMNAGLNVAAQLLLTGRIDWQGVGNAFGQGFISGAMSFGVGEIGKGLEAMGGESVLGKSLMHGASQGLQSMASGGDFGNGFAGGFVGNITAGLGGKDLLSRTVYGGLGAGATSALTGGDFGQGFMRGAFAEVYNWGMHEGLKGFSGTWNDAFSGLEFGIHIPSISDAGLDLASSFPKPFGTAVGVVLSPVLNGIDAAKAVGSYRQGLITKSEVELRFKKNLFKTIMPLSSFYLK